MKDEKKSVVEEALAEFSLIQENLNSNTKEILRSVAKEEITSTLKESLYEDEYDIEDIEDVDSDVDALPVDDAPEAGSEELGIDDIGMDTANDEDLGLDAEEGSEDYGMDMTGASDEEVISVYKKLSGEDEIEVVSSDEVIIRDPESGSEYNVKLGGGSLIDQGEMDAETLGSEVGVGSEVSLGDDEMEPEMDADVEGEEEMDVDAEVEMDVDAEVEAEPETDEEDSEESEEDEDVEEGVVYEIELSEDEEISEGHTEGHKKSKIGATLDNTDSPEVTPVNKSNDIKAANTGDIDGQKAPIDKETSGDNLTGGFDDDAQNGSGDAHATHIMEDESEDMNEGEDEAIDEEVENVDEKIQVGKGRTVANTSTEIKGAGGKANNVKAPNVTANESRKLAEAAKKYNALLAEAKKIKKENDMFRASLKDFRKSITETAVFNTNLSHVTKLFLEHSTTSEEKKNILSRFDEQVNTIEESKKLYKTISSELGSKKPISESIENKLVSEKTSSQSNQLNETTAYVDPAQKRVLDLINRTR